MFKVFCPVNLLWHPSVHHSLLLLRGLKQSHTLVLQPARPLGATGHPRFPLLNDNAMHISVTCDTAVEGSTAGYLRRVYAPEHILWMLVEPSLQPIQKSGSSLEHLRKDLPAYLETAFVASHLLAGVDAILIALNTGEMETTRQLHASFMDALAQLDDALRDESPTPSAAPVEPLSTWPLYAALQLLIEQGGLLASAYPRISAAYTRLSQDAAVVHHKRLIERTIDGVSAADMRDDIAREYPAKGFLIEVQHRLRDYTTSTQERITEGVTGDKGPLQSRVSGGRMGLQTVPARMPWTVKQTPLTRR